MPFGHPSRSRCLRWEEIGNITYDSDKGVCRFRARNYNPAKDLCRAGSRLRSCSGWAFLFLAHLPPGYSGCITRSESCLAPNSAFSSRSYSSAYVSLFRDHSSRTGAKSHTLACAENRLGDPMTAWIYRGRSALPSIHPPRNATAAGIQGTSLKASRQLPKALQIRSFDTRNRRRCQSP